MGEQRKHYEDKLAFEIDSWDLHLAMQSDENIIVVDARSAGAFAVEHIAGAINIPHRQMSPETTKQIDLQSLVVTYCDGIGCNASTRGALNMLNLGYRVRDLQGGLDWWKRDGHPTHQNPGTDAGCGCA
jgi:rhodanese-related sulfurtransferase